MCGCGLWNLGHVTELAFRILRCRVGFRKICVSPHWTDVGPQIRVCLLLIISFFTRIRKISKSDGWFRLDCPHVRPYVRLDGWNTSAPFVRLFMNFDMHFF